MEQINDSTLEISNSEPKKNSNYNKAYYEAFKNKHSEKIKCTICKCSFSYYAKAAHLKSKRHMEALNFENNI
jgi:hypothetical protein